MTVSLESPFHLWYFYFTIIYLDLLGSSASCCMESFWAKLLHDAVFFKKEVPMKLFGTQMNATNLAVGAGIVLIAPVVLPIAASVLKPLAKAVIKGGIIAYEGVRVSIAETKETLEDLAAEAKAEISQEKE